MHLDAELCNRAEGLERSSVLKPHDMTELKESQDRLGNNDEIILVECEED